jgi:hypothetical protein
MRNLILIAMVVGGAFAAGWFTINREGDRTTIEFNRAEIRQDTRRAIDKGREILDRREQQIAQQQNAEEQNAEQWGQRSPQPLDDRYDPRYSEPRFAERNATDASQRRDYRQAGYEQPGYDQRGYPQDQYQDRNDRDSSQAPWNRNSARPDPNAYDAPYYGSRQR